MNSFALCQEGVNYDENAQIIRKFFEKNEISIYSNAIFNGNFKNGIVSDGTISYKQSKEDDYKIIKYKKEE